MESGSGKGGGVKPAPIPAELVQRLPERLVAD